MAEAVEASRPVIDDRKHTLIVTLSDDKLTVTMKYNLIDVFDKPEQFEYTVEY